MNRDDCIPFTQLIFNAQPDKTSDKTVFYHTMTWFDEFTNDTKEMIAFKFQIKKTCLAVASRLVVNASLNSKVFNLIENLHQKPFYWRIYIGTSSYFGKELTLRDKKSLLIHFCFRKSEIEKNKSPHFNRNKASCRKNDLVEDRAAYESSRWNG